MSLPSADSGIPYPPWDGGPTAALVRSRLEQNRDDPDALFVLAALRARDGRLDEGMSLLDRVLVIDPGYPGAWFFKATIHRMRGEPDAADRARQRGEAVQF